AHSTAHCVHLCLLPGDPTSLLVYLYVHNPDLPSFPTRRSSDLCVQRRHHEHRLLVPLLAHPVQKTQPVFAGQNNIEQNHVRAKTDRKSTRLNSSHGSISYAVFCLKKKDSRTDIATTEIMRRK